MDDKDTLARTIWGEARGDGIAGMEAVAAVVVNRLRSPVSWWRRRAGGGIDDDTVTAVCRKPWQFSCWLPDDPNRAKLLAVTRLDPVFAQAIEIAERAISGTLADPTNGATSYYAPSALARAPAWAVGQTPCARVGGHLFFRGV